MHTGKARIGRNIAELKSSVRKPGEVGPSHSDETCAVQGAPKSQRLVRLMVPLIGYFCSY